MTYRKQEGAQFPQAIVAPVAVADVAGSIAGVTITLGTIQPNMLLDGPAKVIGTPFNGTTLMKIGTTTDDDAFATSGTLTAGALGAGVLIYTKVTEAKDVVAIFTSTSTITTGAINVVIPLLQVGRIDVVTAD